MEFFKYQGTGNDFIMLDGRSGNVEFTGEEILRLCDRRFGIGADGLIIMKNREGIHFEMDYYNADGTQSFCGNGSRCAQAFAKQLGMITNESSFHAIDGLHQGKRIGELYATKMGDVSGLTQIGEDYFIHTGSPHYIQYVEDVEQIDVFSQGSAIRNSEAYREEGTNVNFVSVHGNQLKVRTFERGVEAETLSCGTGVTAVAISYLHRNDLKQPEVVIQTRGGELSIQLERTGTESFENIWLVGPAEKVFQGTIE